MPGTATTPLPAAKDVKDLFEGLLGKACEFHEGKTLDASGKNLVATYVDDALVMRALVVVDLPLAVYTGAAIGLLPPGGAQDLVADGELPKNHRENAAEVLNIMASLFNTPGSPHLRLYSTHAPGEALAADVAANLAKKGGRVDYSVDVKGYGKGALAVVLV
jgi:hypothetical protein